MLKAVFTAFFISMLTDTHIHLHLNEFADDLADVISRSRTNDVGRWIVPAICSSDFSLLPLLHQQYPNLYFAFGLHPWFLAQEPEDVFDVLTTYLRQNPQGLVAVGECGLDGAIDIPLSKQIAMLEPQLALASQYKLPVILHNRKAHQELLQLVKQFDLPAGGVWHAFSGSRQQAEQFIEMGFMLGIGGVITYERAAKTRKAVSHLPVTSLLLETDGPTMPLAGYQGERNEPMRVAEVLKVLAALRNENQNVLAEQIESNVRKIFPRISS